MPQELSDATIDRELDLAQEAALDVRGTAEVNDAAPGRQKGRCGHGRQRSRCKGCGGIAAYVNMGGNAAGARTVEESASVSMGGGAFGVRSVVGQA